MGARGGRVTAEGYSDFGGKEMESDREAGPRTDFGSVPASMDENIEAWADQGGLVCGGGHTVAGMGRGQWPAGLG